MDMRAQDDGIEFLVGVGAGASIFSCVHSSLWSAKNFGKDPDTRSSCKQFSWVAGGATLGFAAFASFLTRSAWSFVGALAVTVLMMFGYRYSLNSNGGGPQKTPKGARVGVPAATAAANEANGSNQAARWERPYEAAPPPLRTRP